MGKGDKRTRRGKIFAGSFGKTRQKFKKEVFVPSADAAAKAADAPKERKPKVKKKQADEQETAA